jgi:S1-C subfamily serine protease
MGTLILSHKPGDTVQVVVVERGGVKKTFTVTLGVRPVPQT